MPRAASVMPASTSPVIRERCSGSRPRPTGMARNQPGQPPVTGTATSPTSTIFRTAPSCRAPGGRTGGSNGGGGAGVDEDLGAKGGLGGPPSGQDLAHLGQADGGTDQGPGVDRAGRVQVDRAREPG